MRKNVQISPAILEKILHFSLFWQKCIHFPLFSFKLRSFSFVYVFFCFHYFYHEAFMPHVLNVLDAPAGVGQHGVAHGSNSSQLCDVILCGVNTTSVISHIAWSSVIPHIAWYTLTVPK